VRASPTEIVLALPHMPPLLQAAVPMPVKASKVGWK